MSSPKKLCRKKLRKASEIRVQIVDPKQYRPWIHPTQRDLDPDGKILRSTIRQNEKLQKKYNELVKAVGNGNESLDISYSTYFIRQALKEDTKSKSMGKIRGSKSKSDPHLLRQIIRDKLQRNKIQKEDKVVETEATVIEIKGEEVKKADTEIAEVAKNLNELKNEEIVTILAADRIQSDIPRPVPMHKIRVARVRPNTPHQSPRQGENNALNLISGHHHQSSHHHHDHHHRSNSNPKPTHISSNFKQIKLAQIVPRTSEPPPGFGPMRPLAVQLAPRKAVQVIRHRIDIPLEVDAIMQYKAGQDSKHDMIFGNVMGFQYGGYSYGALWPGQTQNKNVNSAPRPHSIQNQGQMPLQPVALMQSRRHNNIPPNAIYAIPQPQNNNLNYNRCQSQCHRSHNIQHQPTPQCEQIRYAPNQNLQNQLGFPPQRHQLQGPTTVFPIHQSLVTNTPKHNNHNNANISPGIPGMPPTRHHYWQDVVANKSRVQCQLKIQQDLINSRMLQQPIQSQRGNIRVQQIQLQPILECRPQQQGQQKNRFRPIGPSSQPQPIPGPSLAPFPVPGQNLASVPGPSRAPIPGPSHATQQRPPIFQKLGEQQTRPYPQFQLYSPRGIWGDVSNHTLMKTAVRCGVVVDPSPNSNPSQFRGQTQRPLSTPEPSTNVLLQRTLAPTGSVESLLEETKRQMIDVKRSGMAYGVCQDLEFNYLANRPTLSSQASPNLAQELQSPTSTSTSKARRTTS